MKKQEENDLLSIEELAAHAMEEAAKENGNTEAGESTDTSATEEESQTEEQAEETKSLVEQIKDFVNRDEEEPINLNFNLNVKALIGGEGLPRFFRRNWAFITVIVFFTCCYVTSRYMMESAVLENNTLTDTLLDRRYKALTLNSELLERTLSSHIEEHLADSTIHTPTEQAYFLKTE